MMAAAVGNPAANGVIFNAVTNQRFGQRHGAALRGCCGCRAQDRELRSEETA